MSGGLGGALRTDARRRARRPVRAQHLRARDTDSLGRQIAQTAREDPLFRRTVVFLTCLHELGHAFGLRHTDAFTDIIYPFRYGGDFLTRFMRFRGELDRRSDSRSRIPLSAAEPKRTDRPAAGPAGGARCGSRGPGTHHGPPGRRGPGHPCRQQEPVRKDPGLHHDRRQRFAAGGLRRELMPASPAGSR